MHTAVDKLRALSPKQVALFWTKVDRGDGCWRWTGSLHERGYGTWSVRLNGRDTSVRPHRVSWFLAHGDMPDGLVVDHLCGNRACVAPEHLALVDHAHNLARVPAAAEVGRPFALLMRTLVDSMPAEEFKLWWSDWLAKDDYGRRKMERDVGRVRLVA